MVASLIIRKGHFSLPKEMSRTTGEMNDLLEYLATTTLPSNIGLDFEGKKDKRKWWMVSFMSDAWKKRFEPLVNHVDSLLKLMLGTEYESDGSPAIIYNHVKTPR